MRRASTLLGILFLAGLLASFAAPAKGDAVYGDLSGPEALFPGEVAQYNVTITGGPVGLSEVSLEYYLTGPDVTGGAPTSQSPGRTSGNQTAFRVNVTAPQRDQTVTLVVKVSARSASETENATLEKSVVVVTPITLSATFHNRSPTAALNVSVRFLVDGSLVGTQILSRIDGNGQATATLRWLPVALAPGSHTIRIEADLDKDGVIEPAQGEMFTSDVFIQEGAPLSAGWSLLIGTAVFIPAFLIAAALRRRKA